MILNDGVSKNSEDIQYRKAKLEDLEILKNIYENNSIDKGGNLSR